jgi:perosamine synthetase
MQVAFARPHLRGHEGQAVADAIATGWVSQGPRVREFEQKFAERMGAADAVATTSCTTALQLALYVSGIGPGDEVIVPTMSFIASANSVWHCGGTPVLVDVDPATYNIDPSVIEAAITPRTKALMPVHQMGLPADMDPIVDIAERHGLTIVEDAACAIGASYKGRPIGSSPYLACFSLHPRKVITSGEGGMITVQDPDVAERLRQLRQHAMSISDLARHGAKDVIIETYPERGWNSRMTDMQAALGLCQLELLDEILERRRFLAERYSEAVASIPYIEAPYEPAYAERAWQAYAVTLAPDAPLSRKELMRVLLQDGVPTRRGVMNIHEEASYAEPRLRLPQAEQASGASLMLPLFPDLTEAEQDYVIDRLAAHMTALAAV